MELQKSAISAIKKVNDIEKELSAFHVERDLELHGLGLALVANTNVLLLGDPGVGKSRMVEDWGSHIPGANHFNWLISQFTVPDELAGAPSLKALEEDRFERRTTGMLPEAHIAFLDEIWKGNSGVINFLLPILNERQFHNEGKAQPIPLLTLVGASNELPEEEDNLAAALDRFVIKFRVETIKEKSNWLKMMNNFLTHDPEKAKTEISIEEIQELQSLAKQVTIPISILKLIMDIKDDVEKQQVHISPRVINQSLRVVQAEALLNNRTTVEEADVEVLRHTFWKEPEHEKIVYGKILAKIAPEKQKVEEIMNEAEILIQDYREMPTDDKTIQQCMSIAQSLGGLKDKLEKIRSDVKEMGKPTVYINKYLDTLTNHIDEILKEYGVGGR